MDGQNNDQNYYGGNTGSYSGEYGNTGMQTEPVAESAAQPATEQSAQSSSSYQDYTGQYSDPLYGSGNSYINNNNTDAGNTYGNNNAYGNNAYGSNYNNGYNNGTSNMYTNNAEVYGNVPVAEEKKTPGTAIASLILGISGILLDCCCGVGTLFGLIGLILGIVGNKNQKSGVGTAGIICSAIALVIGVLMIIYFFVVGGMAYMEEMM